MGIFHRLDIATVLAVYAHSRSVPIRAGARHGRRAKRNGPDSRRPMNRCMIPHVKFSDTASEDVDYACHTVPADRDQMVWQCVPALHKGFRRSELAYHEAVPQSGARQRKAYRQ